MILMMSGIEKTMLNDFNSCSSTTMSAAFWSVEYEIVVWFGSASQMRRALMIV